MSMQRYCFIQKANDQKWYLVLGDFEYADRNHSTIYGPFDSEDDLRKELDRHSNPGGYSFDDSGKHPRPDGKITTPTKTIHPHLRGFRLARPRRYRNGF